MVFRTYFEPPESIFRCVNRELIIPPAWEELRTLLADRGTGVVYVLGPTDTGKSTLCRYLVQELSREAITAYLDCDTGQSTIGPPATVGLALFEDGAPEPLRTAFRFVGSTTPSGHLIQEMAGASRLLQLARANEASFTIIDSPGWVAGPIAGEFHIRMIDILVPDLIVAICNDHELESILANFRDHPRIQTLRFSLSPSVQIRNRGWRTRYRMDRFREYFAGAVSWEIGLEGMAFHGRMPGTFRDEDWRGLLVALCDAEMIGISLAIVETLDIVRGIIRFRSPVPDLDGVSSIQVGSVHLDPVMGFLEEW
jgi:polynucleotide 5'-hydroxyl-kinase GRC3/NOL9